MPIPAFAQRRDPVLDDDARHDIAGVVIAVIGVALLIAVLTPTSGLLTGAVSAGLHALLGMGAFLLPVALIVWALTFFIDLPAIVPGRVALGLALIALSIMGIVGLCTPGCEADPTRLFNAYVLADRGGYVGNGLAWALLALVGKVVGIVILSGVIVAGLIVIGLNATQAVQSFLARSRERRAYSRARSEERAARTQAGRAGAGFVPASADMPQNYAPTALFDPSRPLSQQGSTAGYPAPYAGAPTAYVAPGMAPGQPTTVVQPGPFMPSAPLRPAGEQRFGCGDTPGGVAVAQTPASVPMPAENPARAASEPYPGTPATRVMRAASMPTTFVAPEPAAGEDVFCYRAERDAAPAPSVPGAPDVVEDAANTLHAAEQPAMDARASTRRPATRRARQASQWWDPSDDWEREDFDPRPRFSEPGEATPLPGVLPGAPVTVDDLESYAAAYAADPAVDSAADDVRQDAARIRSESRGAREDIQVEGAPARSAAAMAGAEVARAARLASRAARTDGAGAPDSVAPAAAGVRSRTEDADDDAASRVSARTRAALEAHVVEQPPTPRRAASHATSAAVELPWEPAHVNAPDNGEVHVSSGDAGPFILPDPSIMPRSKTALERSPEQRREAAEMATALQTTLSEFGVKADVVDWVEGPTCTTYEVNPGEGVRVNRFTSLEDDIARALARNGVRIYAPVPGTSYVGIEVPNTTRQTVLFGDVLPYVDGGPLDFAVGLDANGTPVHVDLAKLPHILVAGTTGSGKSVMVNTIVMSMLMRDTPDEVRLIMIDPKQVEFNDYNGIPHLIMPVVTDMRQAAAALQWGVTEMDRRYRVFSNSGVRDLKGYNALVDADDANPEVGDARMPSIVIVIDELADLMMVAKKDVEASIVRIAQLGRACGIHLVMATQSPRADVVTGLIRANVANRIGLKVAKGTDSKIVIDQMGAEKLLGNGDMLFLQTAWGDRPRRIQGCWISDNEISQVVNHLKEQAGTQYNCQMAPLPGSSPAAEGASLAEGVSGTMTSGVAAGNDDDPLAWEAAKLVVENQMGSTSMVQRRLKLGYARAGRVMDMLEEMGVVGPARGSKPREVLVRDLEELATLRGEFDGSEGDY